MDIPVKAPTAEVEAAIRSLHPFLQLHLQPTVLRIVPLPYAKVRVYVDGGTLRRLPVPDRRAVVRYVGQYWCDSAEWFDSGWIEFRDADTAKVLGRFDCTPDILGEWYKNSGVSAAVKAEVTGQPREAHPSLVTRVGFDSVSWSVEPGGANLVAALQSTTKIDENLSRFRFVIEPRGSTDFHARHNPRFPILHTVIDAPNFHEALRRLRENVAWKAPYLFVHTDDATGYHRHLEVVFVGSGPALLPYSEFVVTESTWSAQSFDGKHFYDVYDNFALPSRPFEFLIVLDPRPDSPMVNEAATWTANWHGYSSDLTRLASPAQDSNPFDLWTAIVRCAVLAKYCGRTENLNQVQNIANAVLSRERLEALEEILHSVTRAQVPATWRHPGDSVYVDPEIKQFFEQFWAAGEVDKRSVSPTH